MNRGPEFKYIDLKIITYYIGLVIIGLYAIYVVEYDSSTKFSIYSEFETNTISLYSPYNWHNNFNS